MMSRCHEMMYNHLMSGDNGVSERVRVVKVERRLRVRDAVCPVCGAGFEAVGRGTYCSPSCRRKADHQRHGDARRAANRERYRARQGARNDADGS